MDAEALFAGVDWNKTDVDELRRALEDELGSIEEANIRALLDSSARVERVLPALGAADAATGSVEDILSAYVSRLSGMGAEIAQIEEVNRGLGVQEQSHERLLAELDALLRRIDAPPATATILRTAAEELRATGTLRDATGTGIALRQVHMLLGERIDGGLATMRAVVERQAHWSSLAQAVGDAFVSAADGVLLDANAPANPRDPGALPLRLSALDAADAFLETHAPLLSALRATAPRRHASVCASYGRGASVRVSAELGGVVRGPLLGVRVRRRTAEERGPLFTALASTLTSLSERIYALGGPRAPPCALDFSAIPLLAADAERTALSAVLGDGGALLGAAQAVDYVVLLVAPAMAHAQQAVATALHGLASSSAETRALLEATDAVVYAAFGGPLEALFAGALVDDLAGGAAGDGLCAFEMLAAVDARLPGACAELPVLGRALRAVRRRLLQHAERFAAEQVAAIDAMRYSARRREGVLPFVTQFPLFLQRIEALLSSVGIVAADEQNHVSAETEGPSVRELADAMYARVVQAVFRSLDALVVDAGAVDKERINASVMHIQNGRFLVDQLEGMRTLPAVGPVLAMARTRYDAHVATYARLSLRRVFAAPTAFLEAIRDILARAALPPEDVPLRPEYTKARARTALAGLAEEPFRAGMRTVFWRVEKHFPRDRPLQRVVWAALRAAMLGEVEAYGAVLERVYRLDADIRIPLAPALVTAVFDEYVPQLSDH